MWVMTSSSLPGYFQWFLRNQAPVGPYSKNEMRPGERSGFDALRCDHKGTAHLRRRTVNIKREKAWTRATIAARYFARKETSPKLAGRRRMEHCPACLRNFA